MGRELKEVVERLENLVQRLRGVYYDVVDVFTPHE